MPRPYAKHIATLAQNGVTATNVQEALEDLAGAGPGVTDHGALTGLADDDHPQYALAANGVTGGDAHDHNGGDGAQISYVNLSNKPTPKRCIGVCFDGGGSTPTPGSVGYVVAQFAGTVDRWDIVADVSGSAVVDVWKSAGAIPTDANRIAGTEKPTLTAAQLANDTSLTTWSTLAVAAGDVLGFELESVTTCTRVTAQVRIAETI